MAAEDHDQRLRFLNLSEREAQLLRALRPLFEEHVEAIEDAFYERLLEMPETARLLRDPMMVERLKHLQRTYLLRIVEGVFDQAYFADRLRIGQAHERVGLSPRWYLLGYSHYFNIITPLIFRLYAADVERARDSMVALQKVFMLDASLAMDAYITGDRFRHVQQLESIVNDSGDGIFMLDNEKRFRAWNRAAERIFGWRGAEILGKHVEVITPADLIEAGEMAQIDDELEKFGFCHLETVRQTKDGNRVPVELTVSILRDPRGETIGRSAILRDVTVRRRLEEEKLQSERLAVIGAMSAKLAHEIRNPLSSITLNIDLVRDEIEGLARNNAFNADEARSLIRSIDSEVRRIHRVSEDYLKFARMPKPRRQHATLDAVLTQGLSFMQSFFANHKVVVKTEFEPSLPPVKGDDEQLWEAVLNLIRNAHEAMPEGGALTLRTSREGDEAVLRITDTGKGMSEQVRQQIFKPFFSMKSGGTGLGLPLAQQIITEHGGHIECESVEGQGTTFIIRLPLATES